MDSTNHTGIVARLLNRLMGTVAAVPPENAACEFGCHELQCDHERWRDCEHRLDWADKLTEREVDGASDETRRSSTSSKVRTES